MFSKVVHCTLDSYHPDESSRTRRDHRVQMGRGCANYNVLDRNDNCVIDQSADCDSETVMLLLDDNDRSAFSPRSMLLQLHHHELMCTLFRDNRNHYRICMRWNIDNNMKF